MRQDERGDRGAGPERQERQELAGRPEPLTVATAALAREYARDLVRERWGPVLDRAGQEDLIDLQLVVSELVTNAVRHGAGLAGFEAWAVPGGVRLAVHDNSDVVPEAAYGSGALPLEHRGNGYGWPLVIRLAREISVVRRPDGGKTVSVLVPFRGAPRPSGGAGPAR
ncbi:ATP-binding protein [Streptomyces sp. NPDC047000]|uniref:ATP-binding protein n=1 Tax=Streptomyces sp. NPDC047000 TaxID=3155474 RepID=UPI0033D17C98